MKSLLAGFVPVLALTFGLTAANATPTYDFNSATIGNLGVTSKTYTGTDGKTITAYGYQIATPASNAPIAINLYNKRDGGSESGLGLVTSDSDHEIDNGHFIRLDLSAYFTNPATTLTFTIGSAQTGEGVSFYYAATQTGALTGTAITPTSQTTTSDITTSVFTLSGSKHYVDITASGNSGADVLLSTLTATPEPGFYGALAAGLSGLMFVGMRRRKQS